MASACICTSHSSTSRFSERQSKSIHGHETLGRLCNDDDSASIYTYPRGCTKYLIDYLSLNLICEYQQQHPGPITEGYAGILFYLLSLSIQRARYSNIVRSVTLVGGGLSHCISCQLVYVQQFRGLPCPNIFLNT